MVPTNFQQKALSVKDEYNICLVGGRGGGMTTTLMLLARKYSLRNPKLPVKFYIPDSQSVMQADAAYALLPRTSTTKVVFANVEKWFHHGNDGLELFDNCIPAFHKVTRTQHVYVAILGNTCPGTPWLPCYAGMTEREAVFCPVTYRSNPHLPADYATKLVAQLRQTNPNISLGSIQLALGDSWRGQDEYPDPAPEATPVAIKCTCGVSFTGGIHSDWCDAK